MLPYALADRLQGLEAGGPGMRMDADAFGGAMIECDEHRGLAFAGDRRRQVGTPHRINPFRDDGAVWLRGPRGEPTRVGASRLFCRISHSTRRNEVRVPACRNRAQTLRCPSPWNGLAESTPRIAVVSASSDIAPSGPRRCAAIGGEADRWRYTPERGSRHTRQTTARPYGLPVTGEITRLIAVLRWRDIRPPRPSTTAPDPCARSASPEPAPTWFV